MASNHPPRGIPAAAVMSSGISRHTAPAEAALHDVIGDLQSQVDRLRARAVLAEDAVRAVAVTPTLAQDIAAAIRESCAAVLAQRGIADRDGSLARELGNNGAQNVVFLLSERGEVRS